MAKRKCISYGIIFKRSSCLNSPILEAQVVDAGKYYTNLKSQLENLTDGSVNPSVKNSLRSFMKSICDISNANKYYRQPLSIIEKFNEIDHRISNEILVDYTTQVLPYVEDLSGIKETLNRYELFDNQRDKILETASQYIVADRILNNHSRISKRFNIESDVSKINSKGLKSIVESCCTMIDTYTLKPYQKLNLCIEELTYLFGRNNVNYDSKDLVAYVTEYFLINNPIMSTSDLQGYRTALNESYCLSEEDLEKVQYIYKDDIDENNNGEKTSIKKEIERFLRCPEKNAKVLEICIDNSLNNNTKLDIVSNFYKLIWLIWDVYKSGIYYQDKYLDINIEEFFDKLIRKIENDISDTSADSFTREDICLLINSIIEKVESIININVEDDYEYTYLVSKFKSNTNKLVQKLIDLRDLVYPEDNLNSIEFVNNESVDIMSIKEFKIFKFHNLVKASLNLDEFLKLKSRKIYDKGNKKIRHIIRRVKDVLFSESADIYSFIGEDSKIDFCVAQYYIEESNIEDIHEFFNEVCNEYNHKLQLEGNFTSKSYYIINPGIVEVHLKDSTGIKMEESDWNLVKESENCELDIYIDEFATIQSLVESYLEFCSEYTLESVQDKITKFAENNNDLDIDHYMVALEALSLLEVSKEDINIFSEKFGKYRYNTAVLESVITEKEYQKELDTINKISNDWVHEENVPIDIQWEAYQILCAVLEDAPKIKKPEVGVQNKSKDKLNKEKKIDKSKDLKDPKNQKEEKELSPEEVEEIKKNPFKGININSIKLYLEGLKGKMKDMSQKEKEISRNLDNNFRRFVKGMKDALISDRREAIIKGSVIPSFSKCIKIIIGLAGTGFATGNALVPIIIAIAGFAMSKRLTKRERLLLLDEIETELEVIEKEISLAESKNQIKKYRALLKYKKDLQRQYQRIRYNVRVGKDLMPNSTAGLKSNLN